MASSMPWQCHVGSETFFLEGGGICSRCHQPACELHLRRIRSTGPDGRSTGDEIACVRCLKAGEAARPWKHRIFGF
jgi:hypothetical protein